MLAKAHIYVSLDVDYDDQSINDDMPAVMFADAQVNSNGSGSFEFSNAGAVIGICNAKGVPVNSTISMVAISGSNLSGAKVIVEGGNLVLKAEEKATDAIFTAALSEITVTDANGTLSSPVFIAVTAGARVSKVTLTVGETIYGSPPRTWQSARLYETKAITSIGF